MVDFEISAITDEFSKDFGKVCAYFSDQDVKYVEIRNTFDGNILTMDEHGIGNIKDILNEYDMSVSCISGGTLKCIPPSEKPNPGNNKSMGDNWKYNFNLIDHAIDLAVELDSPYIRCFGFRGNWNVPPVSKWRGWKIYQEWSEKINEMKQKAAAKGKMFICENDAGLNKSLPQIEKIGKDHCGEGFGMLYDMANVANKFHEEGVLTDEWLDRIAKYFQYIHAKGTRKRLWFIYHTYYINGKNDITRWPEVIKHLRGMDKDDFVAPAPDPLFLSIETHFGKKPRWKYSVQNLKNLKSLLQNY